MWDGQAAAIVADRMQPGRLSEVRQYARWEYGSPEVGHLLAKVARDEDRNREAVKVLGRLVAALGRVVVLMRAEGAEE